MRKSRKKKNATWPINFAFINGKFRKRRNPQFVRVYLKNFFFRFYCCLKNDYNILNEFLMNLTDTSFQLITTVKLIG